jgi:histone deacetylase 6
MGDSEYKNAFDCIVLPVANQFDPDLIIATAGFDAVVSDPLGDYVLTTDMYAYMTEKLSKIGTGRIMLVLEGGYNAKAIGECLVACTKVLTGDRSLSIELEVKEPCRRAQQTIRSVIQCQSKYWNLAMDEQG